MTLRNFDDDYEPPTPIDTIQSKFEDFHRINPWVFDRLERLTIDLLARGQAKVGLKMLFEVLRWQHAMGTTDPHSEFKLNNNYTSRYARLLIETHPTWDTVFETRELKA